MGSRQGAAICGKQRPLHLPLGSCGAVEGPVGREVAGNDLGRCQGRRLGPDNQQVVQPYALSQTHRRGYYLPKEQQNEDKNAHRWDNVGQESMNQMC